VIKEKKLDDSEASSKKIAAECKSSTHVTKILSKLQTTATHNVPPPDSDATRIPY